MSNFGARGGVRHSEVVEVYGEVRLHSGNFGVRFMWLMFGAEEQPAPLRGRCSVRLSWAAHAVGTKQYRSWGSFWGGRGAACATPRPLGVRLS